MSERSTSELRPAPTYTNYAFFSHIYNLQTIIMYPYQGVMNVTNSN